MYMPPNYIFAKKIVMTLNMLLFHIGFFYLFFIYALLIFQCMVNFIKRLEYHFIFSLIFICILYAVFRPVGFI